MSDNNISLPPGYSLDAPSAPTDVKLPQGYTLDTPEGEKPEGFWGGVWKNMPHPIDTITEGVRSSANQFGKARDAFGRGEYGSAAAHAVGGLPGVSLIAAGMEGSAAALDRADAAKERGDTVGRVIEDMNAIPLVGPMVGSFAQRVREGNLKGAAGEAVGAAGTALLPKAVSKALPGRMPAITPTVATDLTPTESAAVHFADQNDIPIDAATRTGNRAVANSQASVANSPGGASIANEARTATREALTRTANRLGARVMPTVNDPIPTPETAGAGVAQHLQDLSAEQGQGAMKAYSRLEQIEALPKHAKEIQVGEKTAATGVLDANGNPISKTTPVTKKIALPVDMRAAKASLKPVLERLEQEMPIAQQQASRGLQAVRNVVESDDHVPASVADANLSALKQLQRETIHPKTKLLANRAVNAVAPAVDAAVAGAGPEAMDALNEGRLLTKAKYATEATADQLNTEPVRLFKQLTTSKDASINLLRDVQSKAPGALPAVSRAYLEGLFESATSEGGKPGAGTAFSEWQKLGDETKKVLFSDPAVRTQLDNFFTLAKKIGDNPNPSGTAYVSAGQYIIKHPFKGIPYVITTNALARLFFKPENAKLLISGLRPSRYAATKTVLANSILRMAGPNGARPLSELPKAAAVQSDQPAETAALR